MFDSSLRETKDRLLMPLARRLRGVRPYVVTGVAFVVGLAGVVAVMRQHYGIGVLLWLSNRLLDGLDGTMARANDQKSDLGGYLDILLDFVIYAAFPVALVVSMPSLTRYLSLAFLLGSFYVNAASWIYLSAVLEKRTLVADTHAEDTTVTMPAGIIGGTETVLFYCIFLLWPAGMSWLFAAMASLVLITIVQRLIWAIRHLA